MSPCYRRDPTHVCFWKVGTFQWLADQHGWQPLLLDNPVALLRKNSRLQLPSCSCMLDEKAEHLLGCLLRLVAEFRFQAAIAQHRPIAQKIDLTRRVAGNVQCVPHRQRAFQQPGR